MSVLPFTADRPDLGVPLQLIGPAEALDLSDLVVGEPTFERTIDGPSTIVVTVQDPYRNGNWQILSSGQLNTRNFTGFDGIRFEQAALSKQGDGKVTFTFEDAIVRALKRQKSAKVWNAGSITRANLAKALAAEAGVQIEVDPEKRPTIADTVLRNMTQKAIADDVAGNYTYTADPDGTDSSWSLLGALASDIGWRACSDGQRILFGSDAWLMSRAPAIALRDRQGAVVEIAWELDEDQTTATATIIVDVDRWAIAPGQPITLSGEGPADGAWLVETFKRPYRKTRGTVQLTRARKSLVEPVNTPAGSTGDAGELDYLDDALGGYGFSTPSTSARAAERANAGPLGRFMDYALAQIGKPYELSFSGPNKFDCSGLVQQAARAGGINFPKPVSEQVARARKGQGRMISVREALMTRGALLYRDRPGGGNGAGNHIAISLGDGNRTMEARGKAYGCGIFGNAAGRQWDGGFVLDFSTQRNAVGTGQIGGPR